MELQITANLILPRPSFCCFKLPIDLSPTTLPPSSSLNSQSASTPNTMTFTKSNETVPPTIYNLQAHLHPLRISPVFPFCDTEIPPPLSLSKFPNIYPKIPRVFTTADHESRFGCQSFRFLLQWHQSRYLVVASHDTECLRLILTLLSIPTISASARCLFLHSCMMLLRMFSVMQQRVMMWNNYDSTASAHSHLWCSKGTTASLKKWTKHRNFLDSGI